MARREPIKLPRQRPAATLGGRILRDGARAESGFARPPPHAFKTLARYSMVLFIVKALAVVVVVAVAFVALTPVLEVVMPNFTSVVPGAIQSDVDHIGSSIEDGAGQAIDAVAGGIAGAATTVTDSVENTVTGAASTVTDSVEDTVSAVSKVIP